ncbi:PREDICTED: homocysteine S-methyltransferase 1-like [Dinoponera quadriceps]|uniref:Homocysteine S-methyltransferase 1-like n=1 Tax=Dinoponera quadriceps TaxID=609295 RepID=A0A6P3WXK0_DINQU|nr:PREDICTED: homocysteine S-methyltransferase 1-like [Dinoponera quadriceps]
MDKFMVLDGDFKAELRRHFPEAENFGNAFTLHALKKDRWAVFKTHLAFLRAGAQIIRTNTYQVSIGAVARHLNLPPIECAEMIQRAVKLAKQAVMWYGEKTGEDTSSEQFETHRPLIAGSCGSYMVSLLDDTSDKCKVKSTDIAIQKSVSYLKLFHKQHIRELLEADVDLLAFESIPSKNEVNAIIDALKDHPKICAWITFYCPQNTNLVDGSDFAQTAVHCYNSLPEQIIAIGAECDSPTAMTQLMRNLNNSRKSKIPFMLCADKNFLPTTRNASVSSAAQQHNFVQEWWDAGVRYIGGGTDTVAEDIQHICKKVEYFCESTGELFLTGKPCSYRNKKHLFKL